MTKPAYIYFDLDNTLLNHSSAESAAQKEIFESFQELQDAPYTKWIETYRTVNHHLWELYQKGEVDRHQLQRRRFFDSMDRLG
ncbi:MAG: HAD family hydrolase, partial [Balneolaceae bacterium]|nr:HAD family hydrolase [Balneolaceae bacterium]